MFQCKKLYFILLSFSFSFLLDQAFAAPSSTYLSLPYRGSSLVNRATYLQPIEKNKVLNFTVWLKVRNKEHLDQYVREIYDPGSARYQKFLTLREFNQQYAPTKKVENDVSNYFSAHGMQTKIINHSVRISATAEQIEKILNVKMNYYRYQNRIFYANATAPKLRADIAEYVAEISGLNTMVRFEPTLHRRAIINMNYKPHNLKFSWKSFIPSAQPTTTSLAGFTGAQLQATYNIANITPIQGTAINGAGQTLVIIDACDDTTPSDIMSDANLYNSANGITLFSAANFAVVNPDGTPFTTCPNHHTGWKDEIALDVESSHTLAPGANTVLVLSRNDNVLDAAVHDVITNLIANNYTIAGFSNAYVVSNSWGGSETGGSSPATETTLETAAASGISFNFSTGDCGDGTYNSSWPCTNNGPQPSVQFPASSAYTTAVGGTSMFVDSNWNYSFETLWGSYYNGAFYGGTVGGISQYYGPVTWQSAISNFTAGGYTAGTVGFYNMRALPDIAMLADPYTGLTIYEGGQSFVYGGTSLACPLFSATLTLLNQVRTLLNGGSPHPIGQAAPYLYTNNSTLLSGQALNLIAPPHMIIDGATLPPAGAPLSAFRLYLGNGYDYFLTFGWDSSMTITPEDQFWNDGVGVGSPNLPKFLSIMAQF